MKQTNVSIQHVADGIDRFDQAAFEQFGEQARQLGYDQTLVRNWDPNTIVDSHTHPFAVQALVVSGKLWLTIGETCHELEAGSRFSLGAQVPHAERYGPEGAVFWLARRNTPT